MGLRLLGHKFNSSNKLKAKKTHKIAKETIENTMSEW
jgi:hypothetical protein